MQVDPYAATNALADGFNQQQVMAQSRARRDAGNALAGGNTQGAMSALGGAGLLQDQRVIGQDMTRDADAQRERDQEETEARKAFILQSLDALERLPPDQVQDVWMTQLRPIMAQMGMSEPDLLQLDAADKSPASLQAFRAAFGGENPEPWANDRSGPGGSVIRPQRAGGYSEVYTPPVVPDAPSIPTGWELLPDGSIQPRRGLVEGQGRIAAAGRAPPRPRAGNSGVNGSARPGSAGQAAPADARRPWERY